jgi:hypothetical protein
MRFKKAKPKNNIPDLLCKKITHKAGLLKDGKLFAVVEETGKTCCLDGLFMERTGLSEENRNLIPAAIDVTNQCRAA